MIRSLAAALAVGLLAVEPAAVQPARAHWPVQAADEETQRLIDRGVMMLYAFDEGEARIAFGEARKRAPDVALAYWGAAEADTIDINLPQTAEGDRRGTEVVAEGRRRLAHASETERVLLDAIAKRYGPGTKKERFARYADALSAWSKAHRDDANVLTVAAFAIWNAEDALFDGHDNITPKVKEMLADLDDALKLEPTNLGAHHLRIHLLEELRRAQDAVPDADALSSYGYPPGTSHLPHMAGHIWARVGEYARLVDDNERAVANDKAWFAQGDGAGQHYMRNYHGHDVDFVLYGLTTVGRNDDARAFAKNEDALMQSRVALRLHDDAAVLKDAPASWSLGRAIAAARIGNVATAKAERAKIEGDDKAPLAALVDAALAAHAGNVAERAAAYEHAYSATKSSLPGDPKNWWFDPIGEGYGAALLTASRSADAEKIFSAELKRFPNDPHLEWGLAEALKAQHKDDAAPRTAYKAHWKGSRDLTLADLG